MRALLLIAALWLGAVNAASAASVAPLAKVSGISAFAGCAAPGLGGTSYIDSEVEPAVAVDPRDPDRIIGVFQQDPWSNRGAHALVAAVCSDGGASWTHGWAAFSVCQGGAFVRASNPWVSIGPDGTVYQSSLSTLAAIQASTSDDGGTTWGAPATIIAETGTLHANDKESVTADPYRPGRGLSRLDPRRPPQ